MFLQNVKCLRYGTLRYVTWGWKTRISRKIRQQQTPHNTADASLLLTRALIIHHPTCSIKLHIQ